MKITLILIMSILLVNCSSNYVKNKKMISSPNDLMKFTNVWCEKNKSTDDTKLPPVSDIKNVCANGSILVNCVD